MNESFNSIKGFVERDERKALKERRIERAIYLLKNGEAIYPGKISDMLRQDLKALAFILLQEAKEQYEASLPKETPSEKREREKALAAQEREFRRRASFIERALVGQTDMASPDLHCKAKTRAPNRGFYREPMPTPREAGPKIRFIRPKGKE